MDIYEKYAAGRMLFLPYASNLLYQAAVALDAGAPMGASLLCRSALDAAAYEFFSRVASLEPGVHGLTGTFRKVPRKGRYADMSAVRAAVRRAAELDEAQVAAGVDVQARGDLGAPPAEQVDRFYREYREVEAKALREKGVFVPTEHTWVDADHALEDVRATAEILARLEDILNGPPVASQA